MSLAFTFTFNPRDPLHDEHSYHFFTNNMIDVQKDYVIFSRLQSYLQTGPRFKSKSLSPSAPNSAVCYCAVKTSRLVCNSSIKSRACTYRVGHVTSHLNSLL